MWGSEFLVVVCRAVDMSRPVQTKKHFKVFATLSPPVLPWGGPDMDLGSMILANWSAESQVSRRCKLQGEGLPADMLTLHPLESAMAHQLV